MLPYNGGKNGAATMKRLFNERNKNGSTPVEMMAEEGAMDAILQLWAHGADVSFADDSLKSKKVRIYTYILFAFVSNLLASLMRKNFPKRRRKVTRISAFIHTVSTCIKKIASLMRNNVPKRT